MVGVGNSNNLSEMTLNYLSVESVSDSLYGSFSLIVQTRAKRGLYPQGGD